MTLAMSRGYTAPEFSDGKHCSLSDVHNVYSYRVVHCLCYCCPPDLSFHVLVRWCWKHFLACWPTLNNGRRKNWLVASFSIANSIAQLPLCHRLTTLKTLSWIRTLKRSELLQTVRQAHLTLWCLSSSCQWVGTLKRKPKQRISK